MVKLPSCFRCNLLIANEHWAPQNIGSIHRLYELGITFIWLMESTEFSANCSQSIEKDHNCNLKC